MLKKENINLHIYIIQHMYSMMINLMYITISSE